VARELVRPKYITSGSKSPWLVWNAAFHSSPSPVFFVKKKDGGLRFIQDYPLPVINDLINCLKGARFFTTRSSMGVQQCLDPGTAVWLTIKCCEPPLSMRRDPEKKLLRDGLAKMHSPLLAAWASIACFHNAVHFDRDSGSKPL
jgi:hypothetical protein